MRGVHLREVSVSGGSTIFKCCLCYFYYYNLLGGDQLTRVRFTAGRKLRAGSHTLKDRLEHTQPDVIELFHTKQAFLTVSTHFNH